jgi:SAM-dependent methyltransferase
MRDPYRDRYYPTMENPDWHRVAVGDLWDAIGRLQFDFLVSEGLEQRHRLLDVGCGALRGGVHFVRYLDPGHYVGTDKSTALLNAGWDELVDAGLEFREATLVLDDGFHLSGIGAQFDFALAQSLFTHIPPADVARCIRAVASVLVPGGRFYATFLDAPDGVEAMDRIDPPTGLPFVSRLDADPYHQSREWFERLCVDLPLRMEHIGEWGHPRNQQMLCFTRA